MGEFLPRLLLLAHLAATLFMTGLIWFVQVVHYPLFAGTGCVEFPAYQRRHVRLTTRVVGPPMLVEAATGVLLFWRSPAAMPAWPLWLGAALLAFIWMSTALVQVPCHDVLAGGMDPTAHRRLVLTNWVRTAAWSLRASLVLWMTYASLR